MSKKDNTVQIPDFLIEMSKRMNTDPNRATAHPFWQVRTKEYLVTEEGYSEHHWEVIDSECGTIYRSDKEELSTLTEFLKEHHLDWLLTYARDGDCEPYSGVAEFFESNWENDFDELPDELSIVHLQEVEKVVWTGLTEQAAKDFIARKQHDYPPLFTYVESAYWSPELRELQDWIKSLTEKAQ